MARSNDGAPPGPHGQFPECVILRPLPKVIFLYPTVVASAFLGVLVWQWPRHDESFATAFLVIAFLNFLVLAFDFPRTALLTAGAFALALVLAVVLVTLQWEDALPNLVEWALGLDATANSRFYFAFSGALAALFLLVLLVRFKADYLQVTSMEVRHCLLLGHTVTLRMDQVVGFGAEKPDVLEYLLLGSGRIWIQPERNRTLVIEHVPRIDLRERQISHLLSHIDTLAVRR